VGRRKHPAELAEPGLHHVAVSWLLSRWAAAEQWVPAPTRPALATFLLKILALAPSSGTARTGPAPRRIKNFSDFPAREPGQPSVTRKTGFHLLSPDLIT
jgi:hypothetical protein